MVGVLTKDDFRELEKLFATKADLAGIVTKEDAKAFATKNDLNRFATKDDLKAFATKNDLKGFATKDDLVDLRVHIDQHCATKDDLDAAVRDFAEMVSEAFISVPTRPEFYQLDQRLRVVERKTPYQKAP